MCDVVAVKHVVIIASRAGLGQKSGPGILAQTGPLHMNMNTTEVYTALNM